jgi:hypothetical protein
MGGNACAHNLLLEKLGCVDRGRTMFQDSWTLYDDEPIRPKKWIFHPRKRSVMGPLLTIGAALLVLFEAFRSF